MRGRPADWQSQLAGDPPAVLAAAAAAAGFDGIYINRVGYADSTAFGLEATLTRLLRTRPIVSKDGRLSFFDARLYAKRLMATIRPPRLTALRNATLYPVRLDAGAGAQTPPSRDFPISGVGIHGAVRIRQRGELEARNPSAEERAVIFEAQLSIAGTARPTTLRFPGARPLRLVVGRRPVPVCRLLHIRRDAAIRFKLARPATLHIDGARLTDLAYEPVIRTRPCRD